MNPTLSATYIIVFSPFFRPEKKHFSGFRNSSDFPCIRGIFHFRARFSLSGNGGELVATFPVDSRTKLNRHFEFMFARHPYSPPVSVIRCPEIGPQSRAVAACNPS